MQKKNTGHIDIPHKTKHSRSVRVQQQQWSLYTSSAGMCTVEGVTGTIAATGTTPHTTTARRSHLCQVISQAIQRATGNIRDHYTVFINTTTVLIIPQALCDNRKYRHYSGNRHYSAYCHHSSFPSVPSDIVNITASNRHYRATTTLHSYEEKNGHYHGVQSCKEWYRC